MSKIPGIHLERSNEASGSYAYRAPLRYLVMPGLERVVAGSQWCFGCSSLVTGHFSPWSAAGSGYGCPELEIVLRHSTEKGRVRSIWKSVLRL